MERSRVGLSVCLSVRPFVVCPIVRQQERRATGLLLSALRAGYRSIAGPARSSNGAAARRTASNTGSVMLTAELTTLNTNLFSCLR